MITGKTAFDVRDLRNAYGSFGTGVTVVTSRHPQGRLAGVTVNSFSSVSLEPPIVSWSLATFSPSLAVFDEAGRFAINVLSIDQLALSRQFASRLADKFAGVRYREGREGVPLLEHCAATIECRTIDRHVVGDHVLFLGQVEDYAYHRKPPLLFCQGNYLQGIELERRATPAMTDTSSEDSR